MGAERGAYVGKREAALQVHKPRGETPNDAARRTNASQAGLRAHWPRALNHDLPGMLPRPVVGAALFFALYSEVPCSTVVSYLTCRVRA